jgi:hypothetical protein
MFLFAHQEECLIVGKIAGKFLVFLVDQRRHNGENIASQLMKYGSQHGRGLYFGPKTIFIPPSSINDIFPPLGTHCFSTPIVAFFS